MLVFKALAAFCLGLAVLTGLQTMSLSWLQRYLKSDRARVSVPVMGKTPDFTTAFKSNGTIGVLPKFGPIDTTAGQRAHINSLGHQMYLQHRAAQNAVPLPPRIPTGIRR